MCCSFTSYSWNATGHQLVAQIAYNHLTPEGKRLCSTVFDVSEASLEPYFVSISTWLDAIRKKNVHQFDAWHYVDIPFTRDKSKLPAVNQRNALWAIKQAQQVLLSNKTNRGKKALYLKILIHVTGDIHQPLHAATKVSKRLPEGDLGGNLYLFSASPVGKNLHQYWDNGAGILHHNSWNELKMQAIQIERKWPCKAETAQSKPEYWLNQSHQLAINQAYSIRTHKQPSIQYQNHAQRLSEQQIAFAGCRLAYTINKIAALK